MINRRLYRHLCGTVQKIPEKLPKSRRERSVGDCSKAQCVVELIPVEWNNMRATPSTLSTFTCILTNTVSAPGILHS